MRRYILRTASRLALAFGLIVAAPIAAPAQTPARPDALDRPEGRPLPGRFVGDATAGFRFVPEDGTPPIAIDGPAEIGLGGKGPGPNAGVPPIQVILGAGQRISGQLVGVDPNSIRLGDGPGGRVVTVDRRGTLALRQRSGEAIVLIDGFETLDEARWSHVGTPIIDGSKALSGEKSLKIAADGSAITTVLAEPVAQGRLELAFHDDAAVEPGVQWFVDLLFKGDRGPESIRAVLGWSEESHAVQSSGGHALAVQRLARKPGWHRLEVRFGRDSAEVGIDGDALAHGKGPTGPLVEVRIGSSLAGKKPDDRLSARVDELRLVRLASGVATGEVDPGQDEIRLLEGDQIFGKITDVDPKRAMILLGDRSIAIAWTEIAGLDFRRDPKPSRPIEGLLARVEWRSAPGDDPRDRDQAEGAIVRVDERALTLETPYAGTLVIPRDQCRRAEIEARGLRIVIDPTAHHLGDEISKPEAMLDPPHPEGGILERKFSIGRLPEAGESARFVLDVVQVVGEANGDQFSQRIRAGELRTKLLLNGKEFDYINKYVMMNNNERERIRVPIPSGLLRPGENVLKIVQTGTANDPTYFDDLGILGIAYEVARPPGSAGKP